MKSEPLPEKTIKWLSKVGAGDFSVCHSCQYNLSRHIPEEDMAYNDGGIMYSHWCGKQLIINKNTVPAWNYAKKNDKVVLYCREWKRLTK